MLLLLRPSKFLIASIKGWLLRTVLNDLTPEKKELSYYNSQFVKKSKRYRQWLKKKCLSYNLESNLCKIFIV